jgi:hypothetical protein
MKIGSANALLQADVAEVVNEHPAVTSMLKDPAISIPFPGYIIKTSVLLQLGRYRHVMPVEERFLRG